MDDFLKQVGETPWPELDAYLETMVIMMTCDGSNDPRELELFTLIGEEMHRHHLPSSGPMNLRRRYDAFVERKSGDERPRFIGSVDRARRARGKPEGVIRMAVGEHDGGGRDRFQALQPVGATIDHDAGGPTPD